MGIVVSSHGLGDDALRALVIEYTLLSMKDVEESWVIFKEEAGRNRFLTEMQFDEVFGILVRDTEPHFQLFEVMRNEVREICAFEAFIAICAALPVDLKAKLTFLFRMYLVDDNATYIASNLKLIVYRDFVAGISKILHVTEPIPSETINAIEGLLRDNNDESKHVTIKEAIEFALTHPLICSTFEELDILFTGLRESYIQTIKSPNINEFVQADESDSNSNPVVLPPEPLWATKIRDIGRVSLPTQEITEFPDDMQCFIALKHLQQRKQSHAMVYELKPQNKKVYTGLITCQVFGRVLLSLMPPMDVKLQSLGMYVFNQAKLSEMEVMKFENYAADAGRRFAMLSLRDVLAIYNDINGFNMAAGPRCMFSDDFAFNLIYRFATYDTHVPIVLNPSHPEMLLGVLTTSDAIRYLLQDVGLLNGKALKTVQGKSLFKPLCMRRQTTSMLEAFQVLQMRQLSGILLVNDTKDNPYSTISWSDILDLAENWPTRSEEGSSIPTAITATTPLPNFGYMLRPISLVLKNKPVFTIKQSNTVAKALTELLKTQSSRVYVTNDSNDISGVIRAADILRLLLEEQTALHTHNRKTVRISTDRKSSMKKL